MATAWPTDGQDALAGGERRSGFHRPGKAAGVAERSRQRLGGHPRQSAGHESICCRPAAGIARGPRRAVGPGEPVQRVHRQPPDRACDDPAAASNVGPPPGVKLRWINTRVFQLDYDTRAMGSAGNVPVELWGTRDGGKSWQSFGKDPKGQSPMLVTVPEEGIYGFRMAIQNGPGMAGRPPLPGDVPGIWIGIDLTRPVGRITLAQQGIGRDGDKLFIAWEASDNRELAARPISLSYSERLGGPWTSMASRPGEHRAVCLAAHRQPAAADVFAAGGSRRRRQHGRLRNAGAGDRSIFPVPPRSFAICVPWAGSTSREPGRASVAMQ